MDTLFSCYLVKSGQAQHICSRSLLHCPSQHLAYPTDLLLFNQWIVCDCDRMDCSMPDFPVVHWVFSDLCLLNRWCHPIVSFAVVPFSSCPRSFPTSGSFPMSWLFASGGQRIGASASVSVLPMNIQGWYSLGLTYNTYYVLNSVLNALHIWIQLILTTSPYFIFVLQIRKPRHREVKQLNKGHTAGQ